MRKRKTDEPVSSAKQRARAVAGKASEEVPEESAQVGTGLLPGAEAKPKPKLPPSVKVESLAPQPRAQRPVGTASQVREGQVRMEGFENIIDNLFSFDPDAAMRELQDFLTLSEKPSQAEWGMLADMLDEAAEKVTLVHQLAANARVRCKMFEMDSEVVKSGVREQAKQEATDEYRAELSRLKDEYKDRKGEKPPAIKPPSLEDVKAYMHNNYHDALIEAEESVVKAKETCNYIDGMVRALEGKQRDLRQLVASARGG